MELLVILRNENLMIKLDFMEIKIRLMEINSIKDNNHKETNKHFTHIKTVKEIHIKVIILVQQMEEILKISLKNL